MKQDVYRYTNNAVSFIVEEIFADSVFILLAAGTGAIFPVLEEGYIFQGTLSKGPLREIVKVVVRNGDELIVVRGQEGTIAQPWPEGTTFENLVTRDVANSFVQAYPDRSSLFGSDGRFSMGAKKPPLTLGSAGTQGDIAYDDDYIYYCYEEDGWRKILTNPEKQLTANLWDFGFDIGTPKGFSDACGAAARILSERAARGAVSMPPGSFVVGVPDRYEVAPNQGAAVWLDETCSNITFVGAAGQTRLIPISNGVEMFIQVGADDIAFKDIYFDNSPNGVLTNQPSKQPVPGGGIAGCGLGANSAIRQYYGSGLTMLDLRYNAFVTFSQYIGDYRDNQIISGTVTMSGCRGYGTVFGLLANQPEEAIVIKSGFKHGINGSLASGNQLPGHLLYLAGETGASPKLLMANDNWWYDTTSAGLATRKGVVQIMTGNMCAMAHRGINSHGAEVFNISANSLKLGLVATIDNGPSAIGITGTFGGGTIGNNAIDVSGTNGKCITLDNNNNDSQISQNIDVHDNTMTNDGTGPLALTQQWISVRDASDITIRTNTAIQSGSADINAFVVDVARSKRVQVISNKRRSALAGNPPLYSHKLVTISSDCEDCQVVYSRLDLDVPLQSNSVINLSTGTGKLTGRNDPVSFSEWSSSLALSFFTNGTFAPTINSARVFHEKRASDVRIWGTFSFTPNSYTGASGAFRVTGLPLSPLGTSRAWGAALYSFENVIVPAGALVLSSYIVSPAADWINIRASFSGAPGAYLGPSAFPPGATYSIGFDMTYETLEG